MNTCFIFREGKLYSKCKIIDKVKRPLCHVDGVLARSGKVAKLLQQVCMGWYMSMIDCVEETKGTFSTDGFVDGYGNRK